MLVINSLISLFRGIQNLLFNPYAKYVYYLSLGGGKSNRFVQECSSEGERCSMLIVTIAYNEETLIRKQIELIKTHIKDSEYCHIVVDNSPCSTKRRLIKQVCREKGIEYIPVPKYIDKLIATRLFWYGLSHGAALNWMFYNVLQVRKPARFALLDHDILPIVDCNLTETLGNRDFYGVKRDRGDGWYLWPGYSIFNFDVLSKIKPNFLPMRTKRAFLDAGGANYPILYKNYDINEVDFAVDKTYRITVTERIEDVYHGDCIQRVDIAWLHIINGSNYAHVKGKEGAVIDIIENIGRFQQMYQEHNELYLKAQIDN